MFSTRLLTLASALLLSASTSLVHAAPSAVHPVNFEVYAPHVTTPSASSVWAVGDNQLVQWDTSSLDDAGKNATGMIFLGYLTPNETSEHLYIDHPLASGFKLGDGQANVTVFDVPTRDSYIVVLLGDSANRSDKFTINGSSASSTATPTESAIVVAPTPSA
ncbi:hypothetical protein BDY19DRAFT_994750 [Irpex rosettiformis]|uniref:Uncharacterized protein n=1 Tax=Irpex rosettiformis TaxID=378272 RepID=A0ACB8U1B0_9APHY|nr:hypothetical protein BDY19DRAFT_994750 [Irpex rosettiformis]